MNRPLDRYADIHSHLQGLATRGDTVVSITPDDTMVAGGTYSVGIHPWATDKPIALSELKRLVAMARDERAVAVGECGYDRLRGGAMDCQRRVFEFQARLAARLGKPLIIHCVRAFDLLLASAKRLRPEPGMWIVHGFRGKPALARQLLDAGMSLSLGEKFNPATAAVIPPTRLYHETDAQIEGEKGGGEKKF